MPLRFTARVLFTANARQTVARIPSCVCGTRVVLSEGVIAVIAALKKLRPGCEGESAAGPQLFLSSLFVWVFPSEWGIMPGMTDDLPEQSQTGQTVLVVDDMSDNLILISLSLQDMGYRVVTATNGADALSVAKLARPDMILMDIAMPQQDGLAATRRIREEAELQSVPVIALTAFDTEGFRQAAFDAGFNGYLTKPIDFERLRNLMRKLLARDKGNTTPL